MMRIFRWLLLVAIALVLAGVVRIYRAQRTAQRTNQRAVPPPVSLDTKTAATDWEWGQSGNGQPQVKLFAKDFKQSVDSERAELRDIELRIYQKDGLHYDRVKSSAAQFTTGDNKLYSPGVAEITLDVPLEGAPPHQLTSITASGINFDSKSGLAVTDQHVSFTFETGDGVCTGASYDPENHTLILNGGVTLNLRGKGPNSKPMKVESQQLAWNETSAVLQLFPWSRLTRDQTVVDAAASTVQMKDGLISSITAPNAHGSDKEPNRQIEYGAELIHVHYNDDGEMDSLIGTGHAKLIAHGTGSDTTMTGEQLYLAFKTVNTESILTVAKANGNGMIESKPLPDPDGKTPDTKVMKANALDLNMKPDGKNIASVETETPGTLEFLPNQISRHRRLLKAERMKVMYGDRNEIQSFYATVASTETYPSAEDRQKKKADLATAYTSSKTIDASFDEHGQLKLMKQSDNFRYMEGVRKAQSDVATLENDRNVMNLETNARISDDSGSTSGDRIQLNQDTGDFDARGHVSTTRLPDQQKSESAMLDKDEPTQGTADRVTSANHNHLIHYAGNAVVWQSSNRIQADNIDIDRDTKTIVADGKVVTQFEDKMQPVFTVVRSQHMTYTDQDRLASYSGGVDFRRPALTVKSATLKAWLNEQDSDADSRINHAFGDGKVEIVQVIPDRQRIGTAEHAEYYTDGGKIVLTGGAPQLNDTKGGNAKGLKLTYFTDEDRLQVDGTPEQQSKSHLRKKK
jgi:lipopolysaccharide export system protein LptA